MNRISILMSIMLISISLAARQNCMIGVGMEVPAASQCSAGYACYAANQTPWLMNYTVSGTCYKVRKATAQETYGARCPNNEDSIAIYVEGPAKGQSAGCVRF